MDPLAVVLLRRTGKVTVSATGAAPEDGAAWVGALEADLAARGRVLDRDLRAAAGRLPSPVRVQWADWLLATVDEMVGADRTMLPLYRSFPDTPRNADAVFVSRLLSHLFAEPGAPCVLCGREQGGAPLDPCGHLVCPSCFPPEQFSACPICGRRLSAGTPYLPVVEPSRKRRGKIETPIPVRALGLETDPQGAALALRSELVLRAGALGDADRADLKVLVTSTAPDTLDWLPETVPARETLALLIAWALHASALTDAYPAVLAEARRRWTTATDVARTLWAYSGGDPGLILPVRHDESHAPGQAMRPVDEPAETVPMPRVRALPRALRRAVLAQLDEGESAEDLLRHPAVWKRLGERLHPFERVAAHPRAAVAFAALRGTRTARESALGAAILAECARRPHRLVPADHPDGTVSVRVRTHASLVEEAFATGDVPGAARLLAERPGDLWRRLDHLLRAAGDDPGTLEAITAAAGDTAGRVSPNVLAAAAAELTGRDATVRATEAQLAAVEQARAAGLVRARGPVGYSTSTPAPAASAVGAARESGLRRALRSLGLTGPTPAHTDPANADSGRRGSAGTDAVVDGAPAAGVGAVADPGEDAAASAGATRAESAASGAGDGEVAGIVGGRPGPGMPRRVFFPRGSTVTTWTEPERRGPVAAEAIAGVRMLVDDELAGRAARLDRFDLAVIDGALATVPAPMRERAASAQLAGWPRGSIRPVPPVDVLRLFLHWEDTEKSRVDLDLSCAFFGADWKRLGHCDYTALRFADEAAVHSGDLTSAPAPLGATEFLDLDLSRLAAEGVRYAVPVVLSFTAVPFEVLTEAFAGLMLPVAGGEQFDAARVEQRFDLRGDARILMPMVLDLWDCKLLWTDLTLPGRGYGHSVGRHGDQLARAASDQWEHFAGGHRATLLDLAAWQAVGRADRIVVAHADGTRTEVPPSAGAIRSAARTETGPLATVTVPEGAVVLVAATDGADVERLVPGPVAAGSVALTVTGRAGEPWTAVSAAEVLGQLAPAQRDSAG
ncbi:MXAN_6230/SCO0854 family RING domain-containing protein [Actinoplanes friuliensis]|uniref:RING-type domain-containing protein n=1 Tax=Actinoplanes friuliensis DSM 7358 TaxID=1246995 RepID=U5WAD0_9ACTN|nr:MXAN_6230/SCO0854 family RING domain-containing protein [Actinoplanes friuliensis]AGZ44901.1 hypothetical protein AFR_33215 [Actinoplanes friuliensis DSM 7358]